VINVIINICCRPITSPIITTNRICIYIYIYIYTAADCHVIELYSIIVKSKLNSDDSNECVKRYENGQISSNFECQSADRTCSQGGPKGIPRGLGAAWLNARRVILVDGERR